MQSDQINHQPWNYDLAALPVGHYVQGKVRGSDEHVSIFRSGKAVHNYCTGERVVNLAAWRKP